jgi:putative transposase
VGNILKRHGIPPVHERKTTMTWKEFIRIHMDVLVATDFFTSEVGTWFTRVIASLLLIIHVGRRTRPVAGVTVLFHERWRLPIPPRCSDGHADVERWRRSVIVKGLSWLLQRGAWVRQPIRSAFEAHGHRKRLHQDMGKVVLLPMVHHYPIRDGPMQSRQRLSGPLKDDNCKAA